MNPYYQHAGITIYHGDNRKIVPLLDDFDLLLTDPPYGIGRDCGMGGGGYDSTGRWKRKPRKFVGGWDDSPPSQETLLAAIAKAKTSIIWGANYFSDILPRGSRWLIWNKLQVMPSYSDAELAWTNDPRVSVKLFTLHCNAARTESGLHPNQKPLELMAWCLSIAPNGVQTVLDPWMGSGTTLRACKDAGLTAVGIDAEEKYCEIAARRMEQEVLSFS